MKTVTSMVQMNFTKLKYCRAGTIAAHALNGIIFAFDNITFLVGNISRRATSRSFLRLFTKITFVNPRCIARSIFN